MQQNFLPSLAYMAYNTMYFNCGIFKDTDCRFIKLRTHSCLK